MSQDELIFFQKRIFQMYGAKADIVGDKIIMKHADSYNTEDIREGMDHVIMEASHEFGVEDAEYDWTVENGNLIVGRILARAYSD